MRESRGREADPSLVVVDTQSIHAAAGVSAATTGKDAAKRVPGRKRGLAVDVLGLVIAVVVLAASVHDNAAGIALLSDIGFVPQPKRWVVEQTLGTLVLNRRLVRDYEHRPASSESRVYWAMTAVIARRLTGATTPTWRDT